MPERLNLMASPLISVVIPSFNRAKYIRQAVDSALHQTWPNVEVIVVDDGSADRSLSILEEYGNRITLIAQQNAGVAAARNRGIDESAGEWIALLDSDDVWQPDKLYRQMQLVERWPEIVLVHTRCTSIDADGCPISDTTSPGQDTIQFDSVERLLHHCEPTTSSVLIKKSVLDVVGKFDVQFEQGGGFAAEDWELYLRVAEAGPFAVVEDRLTIYRAHADSKSLGNRLRHTLGLVHLRRRIEERQAFWIQTRPRVAIECALKVHREQFAHVLGRLGLIYGKDRRWKAAAAAFREAAALEPTRIKHRLRYFTARLQLLISECKTNDVT